MSIYERIGGAPAVSAAVDDFYERVIGDPTLSGYFVDVDLGRLKAHQRAFLGAALGGPETYTGRSLSEAHAGLGITTEAFKQVVEHLVATLKSLGVDDETIAAIGAKLTPLEDDVVEQPAPD